MAHTRARIQNTKVKRKKINAETHKKQKKYRWMSNEQLKIIIDNNNNNKNINIIKNKLNQRDTCLLYTSPSPRDYAASRMPSSA